jgi:hypothetical protein
MVLCERLETELLRVKHYPASQIGIAVRSMRIHAILATLYQERSTGESHISIRVAKLMEREMDQPGFDERKYQMKLAGAIRAGLEEEEASPSAKWKMTTHAILAILSSQYLVTQGFDASHLTSQKPLEHLPREELLPRVRSYLRPFAYQWKRWQREEVDTLSVP